MTWWVALSTGIALLLAMFVLGLPVFTAFLILNVLGVLAFFGHAGFGLFANSIYSTATTTELATVPLFIVMGEILFRSGAMKVLFDSIDGLIGRFRGRQYVLCIVLSAILGALSARRWRWRGCSGARCSRLCAPGATTRACPPARSWPAPASIPSFRRACSPC